MRDDFTFSVRHRAAPQGSKTLDTGKGGKPFMRESSHGVAPFRQAVKKAALGPDGLPRATFKGEVVVGPIEFVFRQAKSNQDDSPTGQNIGDIDKLTRAVLDALTMSGVIEDDRYVIALKDVAKYWGDEDRVTITVRSAARENPFRPVAETVDFVRCACDRITCRECSARRGVLPARLDESGPPRFLPLARNPFEEDGIDYGRKP